MLKIQHISKFNPFEWEDFRCPNCGKNEFTSLDCAAVWCDNCNARFETSSMCEDGVVVHCLNDKSWGQKFKCWDCKAVFGSFEDTPMCPNCNSKELEICQGYVRDMQNVPDYSLLLKFGDTCRGWSTVEYPWKYKNFPTKEQWEKFQEKF